MVRVENHPAPNCRSMCSMCTTRQCFLPYYIHIPLLFMIGYSSCHTDLVLVVYSPMSSFPLFSLQVYDTYECRFKDNLDILSTTALVKLPRSGSYTVDCFLAQTKVLCTLVCKHTNTHILYIVYCSCTYIRMCVYTYTYT